MNFINTVAISLPRYCDIVFERRHGEVMDDTLDLSWVKVSLVGICDVSNILVLATEEYSGKLTT